MEAETRQWHGLFHSCLSCRRTDQPYEGRGLCHPCYNHMVNTRQLHRYPRLTDHGAHNPVRTKRAAHRAAKWRRETIIRWRPLATDRPHIQHAEPGGQPLPDLRGVA